MIQNSHFRPVKGLKFSTKAGTFISQGIWSDEILDYVNRVTGKHHQNTIQNFNDAVDEGRIFDFEL